MDDVLVTVGLGVATILGAVHLIQTGFKELLGWAAVVGFGVLFLAQIA
jgi:hypothetical protein